MGGLATTTIREEGVSHAIAYCTNSSYDVRVSAGTLSKIGLRKKSQFSANISLYLGNDTRLGPWLLWNVTRKSSGVFRISQGGRAPTHPSLSLPPSPPSVPFPPSLLPPLPAPFRPFPSLPSPPALPLEVGFLKSSYGAWGSAVSSPSGVWGGATSEIDLGAF